jgi:hypothetical protein
MRADSQEYMDDRDTCSIDETGWIARIDAWIVDGQPSARHLWKITDTIDPTIVLILPFLVQSAIVIHCYHVKSEKILTLALKGRVVS